MLIINYLLTHSQQLQDGNTLLHLASRASHSKVVSYLIEMGANVNAQNKVCWVLLSNEQSSLQIADLPMQIGWTPLHAASFEGHHEVASILIDKEADLAAKEEVRLCDIKQGTCASVCK